MNRRSPPRPGQDSQAAIEVAVREFSRVDVLVNNAGNFYAGFFEELSPDQVRHQVETLLFGPMNVTRAVLPQMRNQRSGLVLTVSSTGGMFLTAYAAAKFGVEGWMESLAPEIAPFGIRTMLVEPGFFRTELLTRDSTTYAEPTIDDYAERTKATVAAWSSMDGKQGGDPAKLADGLVNLAALDQPPTRFAAGADAVQTFEAKAHALLAQAQAQRALRPHSRTTAPDARRPTTMSKLHVNGLEHTVDTDPSTPILWALRDTLGMTGTKFGCGAALCGACTVHMDGQAIRSCVTPISAAQGRKITTIEAATDGRDRVGAAVHTAWVKHDVAQCGYCQSGQIMSATAFLKSLPKGKKPTASEIDAAMAGNICRCGTYDRIRAAVADAAKTLA